MKLNRILIAALLLATTLSQQCPSNQLASGIISDSLTFGSGNLNIQSGVNVQCYTYNFQGSFQSAYTIAVASNGFEGSPSTDLSYYVRPLPNNGSNSIVFQVRTPWRLTQWSQFTITFLAESRSDLQAGNKIADTAFIGGCGQRTQTVYIPYDQNWPATQTLTTRVYINGFTTSSNGGNLYSIRIVSINQNTTGFITTVTVGGNSIVDILYVSYIVFDSQVVQGQASGNIQRSAVFSTTSIPLPNDGLTSISNFIYGMSGFEWNAGNSPSLNITISGNFVLTITITTNPLNYINIQYILFQGSCVSCSGFPFLQGQSCVQSCSSGVAGPNNVCGSCPANSIWTGSSCQCTNNFYNISGICQQCPPGTQWNGAQCVSFQNCQQNANWNFSINQCQCNTGFFNISGICQQCPPGSNFFNGQCVPFGNPCSGNASWVNGACQCNTGFVNISGVCSNCPLGTNFVNGQCIPFGAPCPQNAGYVNGVCQCNQGFVNISGNCQQCPPGSNFFNGQCVPFGNPCSGNSSWVNGVCQCNQGFFNISGSCQQCPIGTQWNGFQCVSIVVPCPINSANVNGVCQCNQGFANISGVCQNCPLGTNLINGQCIPFGAPCPPNAGYVNGVCQCNQGFVNISGVCGICAPGTTYLNGQCIPFGAPCPPNSGYVNGVCQCNQGFFNISGICNTCPIGTTWNGNQCVQNNSGGGGFWPCRAGMNCIMFCNNYPNTIFDSSRRACVCRPGTFFINGSCQSCPNNFNFNGVNCVAPFVCPPNSILMSGVCVCMSGYKRQSSNCVPFDGGNDEDSCPDNYYWSNQQKRCLVCIDGCASCSDGRTCRVCSTGFNRNSQGRCAEICGDGVRFILACDDGNRINGDGCSSNCRVESGWTCFGGSPNSRDFCSNSRPTRIALNPTGQTHTEGKVTQNIRASWLPANLTNGTCSDCLDVKVVSGPQPRGINVRYVPGTSYSFSVEFDYGYEPIPDFRYQARINPKLQNSYFQGIDISSVVGSNLSPNLMAVNEEVATLSLQDLVAEGN